MLVTLDFQGKNTSLERPDNLYGDNLVDFQDMLATALYGVGLELNGEIRMTGKDNGQELGSETKPIYSERAN